MNLPRDFQDIIRLLNEKSVEFLLIGGYALAFHGYPRFTGDLDILVKPSRQNAKKILDALGQFGMASLELTEEDFIKEDSVIQIGVSPLRIDFLTSVSGVHIDDLFKNAIEIQLEDVSTRMISRGDLIKNKRASGRMKDLADIETICGKHEETE